MSPPTGTITFLMTDIEGSTHLWERYPEQMQRALVRHDAIFKDMVSQYGGYIVKNRCEGDSMFIAFQRAAAALSAAAELQQALINEKWPAETPLRVRMALHTGEVELRDEDYFGTTINRCARIRSLAKGGQIFLSLATEQIVRDSLPSNISLESHGQTFLRDLKRPEKIYQVVIGRSKMAMTPALLIGMVRSKRVSGAAFRSGVALSICLPLATVIYQWIAYQGLVIRPFEGDITPGAELKVQGKGLRGARFQIVEGKKGNDDYMSADLDSTSVQIPNPSGEDVVLISIPKEADGVHGKLIARRFVKWMPLPFLFPKSPPVTVQIGKPIVETTVNKIEPTSLVPGQKFVIFGQGLSDAKVLLNNNPCQKEPQSSDMQVILATPDCDKFPCQVIVALNIKDKSIPVGLLMIHQAELPTHQVTDVPKNGSSEGGTNAAAGPPASANNKPSTTTKPVTTVKPTANPQFNAKLAAQARKAFEDSVQPQGVDYSHAQAVAENILRTDPNNPVAMAVKGYALTKVAGQEGAALETLNHALQLFQQYHKDQSSDAYIANMGLGVLYKDGKAGDDKTPARKYLETATNLNPKSGLAQFNLSNWYVDSGDIVKAKVAANNARLDKRLPRAAIDSLDQAIKP